ncbi:MAG: TauD/TfdA family dioxygenase [Kiloniellales bacterium]
MATAARQAIEAPCAWRGRDLAALDDWIWHLADAELSELDAALASVRSQDIAWPDVTRESFPLPRLAERLGALADELENGRGLVLLRGLPVGRYEADDRKRLFMGVAAHVGRPVTQSVKGELMAEIRDEGAEALARGQMTTGKPGETFLSSRARVHTTGALRYHTDRTDVVALLCVRPAKAGGLSTIASSVAIHNAMLERRPDLLELLFGDYPRSRFGEESKNPSQVYQLPVFALEEGRFTSHYSRTYIEAAQLIPGVPRLSEAQLEALELLHALAEELSFAMSFQAGDLQFLNSHVTYHARAPYEDHDEPERKRLLYRLWLAMPNSRPLPAGHAVLWGATEAGALRGGIRASLP